MNVKEIKAVIFDCDGVMFDTADANRMYYNIILDQFNKPVLTDYQFVKVHMFTVAEAIAFLFPEMDTLAPVYRFMKTVGYDRFTKYMTMAPGLRQLLTKLHESGYKRGVATNRTNTMASVLKENRLEHCFEIVVTAADVDHPKPEPDQLLKILDTFAIHPGGMVFIGDSVYDAEAAEKARVPFIAYNNGSLDADCHVNSMAELHQVLGLDK